MPADFKHEIDKSYDGQFYITSRDGKVVKLYPLKEWEALEAKADAAPSSNLAVQRFLNTTSLYGQVVTLDNQGRLTIADRLREKFRLKGEIVVVGQLRHMDIRLKDEFEAEVESNLSGPADADELARFGL